MRLPEGRRAANGVMQAPGGVDEDNGRRASLLLDPVILGSGKRLFPQDVHRRFELNEATPYANGVVSPDDVRDHPAA